MVSRSRFVHAFTSAYSVTATSTVTRRHCSRAGEVGCLRTPRSAGSRSIRFMARSQMSQQRSGTAGGDHQPPDRLTAFPDLPEATVARLPEYLRALHNLAETGHDTVSSEGLAAVAGVNSAKLRKDLSHLGSYGTRGVG